MKDSDILIDDVPLNIGDMYEEDEDLYDHHTLLYTGNSVAISVFYPCYYIETSKYYVWWSLLEDKILGGHRKSDYDGFNFRIKVPGDFDLFCQVKANEDGKKEIIRADEAIVDKFIENCYKNALVERTVNDVLKLVKHA